MNSPSLVLVFLSAFTGSFLSSIVLNWIRKKKGQIRFPWDDSEDADEHDLVQLECSESVSSTEKVPELVAFLEVDEVSKVTLSLVAQSLTKWTNPPDQGIEVWQTFSDNKRQLGFYTKGTTEGLSEEGWEQVL